MVATNTGQQIQQKGVHASYFRKGLVQLRWRWKSREWSVVAINIGQRLQQLEFYADLSLLPVRSKSHVTTAWNQNRYMMDGSLSQSKRRICWVYARTGRSSPENIARTVSPRTASRTVVRLTLTCSETLWPRQERAKRIRVYIPQHPDSQMDQI